MWEVIKSINVLLVIIIVIHCPAHWCIPLLPVWQMICHLMWWFKKRTLGQGWNSYLATVAIRCMENFFIAHPHALLLLLAVIPQPLSPCSCLRSHAVTLCLSHVASLSHLLTVSSSVWNHLVSSASITRSITAEWFSCSPAKDVQKLISIRNTSNRRVF